MTSKNPLFLRMAKYFFYLAFAKAILLTTACKNPTNSLQLAKANQIAIDSSSTANTEIEDFIQPYKQRVEEQMNEILCYNTTRMHKNDTPLNTAIGNMMAHIVMEQGNPIFKSRTNNTIDIVLLNHGGIRAPMDKGVVTTRTAYEIMPFENEIVVATLNKVQLNDMIQYLVSKERAHPFLGLKIKINNTGLPTVDVADKETYYVATNDYLHKGGDNMTFFKDTPTQKLDYKIRNAMIDYFKKVDTLSFTTDDRFIKQP